MAQDKQALMQLVNMLAGTLQGIGQQRQQASQYKTGMARDKARMEQDRELAMKQLDQRAQQLKSENAFRQAQMKSMELDDKATEMDIAATKLETETTQEIAAKTSELSTQGVPTMPQTAFEKYPDIAKSALPGDVRETKPITQEQLAPELMKAFADNPAAQAQIMKSFGGGNLFKSESDILQMAQSVANLGSAGLPWENIQALVPGMDANLKPIWEFSNMMREFGVEMNDTQLQQLLTSIGYTEAQTERILNPVFAPRSAPAASTSNVFDTIAGDDEKPPIEYSKDELKEIAGG